MNAAEQMKDIIEEALRWKEFRPAKRGGVYIPRRGKKAIIITNIPYEKLREALERGIVREVRVLGIKERPNVILVKASIIIEGWRNIVREEEREVKAPSGLTFRLPANVFYVETVRYELPSGRVLEYRVKEDGVQFLRRVKILGDEERAEIEKLKRRLAELREEEADLVKALGELPKVFKHIDDGGLLLPLDEAGTRYRCTKCGAEVRVWTEERWIEDSAERDTGEKWFGGGGKTTVYRTDPEILIEPAALDEETARRFQWSPACRRYLTLLTMLREVRREIKETERRIKKVVASAVERLGLKVVQRDECKVVFNDGTKYRRFEGFDGSMLFWALDPDDAELIYGGLV